MRSGAVKTATMAMQEVGAGMNEKFNKQKSKERQLEDIVKAQQEHSFSFLPPLLFEERVLRFDPAAYPFEVDPCEEEVDLDAATSVWTVCYQWPPTLRVFASEGKSLGRLHNDREYNHQPGEVNYWLPLASSLNLENTLWLESAEDRADWRPVLIGEGEILRFHGTSCRHFTRKNGSGVTRISLDFRCALKQHFRPDFQTGLSSHQHSRRELLLRV
eukprot:g10046.t1